MTPSLGLTPTPATLSFSYTAGAAGPAVQTINVTSTGAAASFTTSVSTTSGGNWLKVTPSSGTTPATISISVTPTGLAGGATYQGAVTLNSTTSGVASTSLSVSLAVTGPGAPVFSSASIVNAMGYQYKLAPDTIFVIFGGSMGPDAFTAADGPKFPNSLAGTSISFTPANGGDAIPAKMIYTSAGQIAGLLPSSIAPGTYAVRVMYNSLTSAPQNVTVIPRSVGIATTNNGGTGTAQANDANVNGGVSFVRFTSGSLNYKALDFTLSPAHPGDVLTLWVTGFGADSANDTGGSSGDQTAAGNFVVLLGDRPITPEYAGASPGYPGLGQINFTIPADIALSCFTSLVVSTGGELSNVVTVPIAAAGAGACSDPNLSTASLAKLDAGQGIIISGLGIAQEVSTTYRTSTPGGTPTTTTGTSSTTSALFPRYNADAYAWLFGYQKIGPCLVFDHTGTGPAASIYLDAGASLPFTGPGLAATAALTPIPQSQFFSSNGPEYTFSPGNGALTAGTYTISGKGGKDIGPFTVSVQFPSTFAATNLNSLTTIDRTQPLNVTWTGGDQDVDVIISSSKVLGKNASGVNIIHTVSMTCTAPATQGSLSIPVAALSKLLPAGIDTASLATGGGGLSVEAVNTTLFNAPLVSGGTTDFGAFTAVSSFGQNVIIQ